MGCNNTTNNRHQEIIKKNQNIDSSKLSNVSKIIQEPEKNKGIIQVNPSNYAMNENYYLICPICEIRSPHIEKLYYKKDIEDFMVKYTCICFDNTLESKEIQLIKILGKTETKNICIKHQENKYKNHVPNYEKNMKTFFAKLRQIQRFLLNLAEFCNGKKEKT